MTQSSVARVVGVSRSFYNRIEAGTTACTPELAAKLATYFGGAVTELEILYPERYPYREDAA